MPEQYGRLARQARRRGMSTADYVQWLVRECGGNKSEAARRAGVSHSAIWHWLRRIKDDTHVTQN